MNPINIAIVGIGNCASSLVQGIAHYGNAKPEEVIGLSHWEVGGWTPGDLRVVAAFDVDTRKVGKDVAEAIFAKPNCTAVFCENVPATGTIVQMGAVLDGVAPHMLTAKEERSFRLADAAEPTMDEVVALLKATDTHVLMNYLPVGSQKATEFYAEAALRAGVAFVNNIPVFIASNPVWAKKFEDAGVPLVGDDIKAQVGATIVHRTLADLFARRGVKLDRTYQLNTGGNTDFLNMKAQDRLEHKKVSKTEAVQSAVATRMEEDDIHVGPSDYVAWQNDNKVCFLRMEGQLFGGVPMNIELRLSVEDSPNSAGVAIDLIRCAALARKRGQGGIVHAPSTSFCKHPPVQRPDSQAFEELTAFIKG